MNLHHPFIIFKILYMNVTQSNILVLSGDLIEFLVGFHLNITLLFLVPPQLSQQLRV